MKDRFLKINRNNSGFTLLETLVAIFVLTFAGLGPITLASFAIRSSSLSQNRIVAFYLAQEAMEYIRSKRDNNSISGANWLNGLNSCQNASGCIVDVQNDNIQGCSGACPKIKYDSATGFYNQASGSDTLFIREVQLTRISSYEEKISVTMTWQERFGSSSITLEENIFDWR